MSAPRPLAVLTTFVAAVGALLPEPLVRYLATFPHDRPRCIVAPRGNSAWAARRWRPSVTRDDARAIELAEAKRARKRAARLASGAPFARCTNIIVAGAVTSITIDGVPLHLEEHGYLGQRGAAPALTFSRSNGGAP